MPEIIDRRISFNAGEISPWLDPRIDLDKYRSACSTLTNMIPSPYGGAFRRMGTIPVGYTLDDERAFLHPFTSGNGTTCLLEFTNLKLRIWTTGDSPELVEESATVIEIDTPYATADLRSLQFSQLNDLLFISHYQHGPRVLARYSATKWRLKRFVADYPATLEVNDTDITLTVPTSAPTSSTWSSSTTYAAGDVVTHTTSFGTYAYASLQDGNLGMEPATPYWKTWWRSLGPSASLGSTPTYSAAKRITLTASEALFSSSMTGQKWLLQYDQPALTQTIAINSASVNDTSTELYVLGTWSAGLTATTSGSGTWSTRVAIQRSYDLLDWETIAELNSNNSDIQHLITGSEDKPCFLRLILLAKTGTIPTEYTAKLDSTAAKHTGMVRLTKYLSTTTFRAVVEFPLPSGASATALWAQDAWGGDNGWPAAVCIHENRLYFAGTTSRPTTIWGSRVDRFEDFRLAPEADAAVSYTLAADGASRIRWMSSNDDLLIGTKTDEWIIARRNGTDTPYARRQSTIGTARMPALLTGDSVLYFQANRRKLREMAWNNDRSRYASNDLSLLSEHLGDSLFVEFSIAANPHTTAWIVLNNGDLLSCLYDREQNITGWAKHNTTGTFESVTVIPGANGKDDEIWFCVKRTIDGADVRLIERFSPYGMSYLKDATVMNDNLIYTDCNIIGTISAGTITGTMLATLEGKTVDCVHDGIYIGSYTITSGEITGISDITLAGVVRIGLPFPSRIEPTFLEFDDPKVSSKVGKKRLTRAVIELYKSRGAQITGNEFRDYVDLKDGLAADDSLFTGLIETYVHADTERQSAPRIRQTGPYPLNVLSITSRYEFENA